MADEMRTKRAFALEEKKRKLLALKARRTNRDVPPPSTPAEASAPGPGNLDEYIGRLLSSTAPAVPAESAAPPPPTTPSEDAPVVSPKETEPVQVYAAPAPPAAAPARIVETFTCGTQTEEEEFPPPSEVDDDEEEKKEDDEPKGDEVQHVADPTPLKALSPEEVEETVRAAPFSAFLNSASKKVERLLGAPLLADLIVDADYAGETDADAEDCAERDRRSREAPGRGDVVRASVSYECSRWTGGRDCTDVDWSPVHRELVLASYHSPSPLVSSSGGGGDAAAGKGDSAVRSVSPDDTPSASLVPRSVGELQSDGLTLIWSLAMPSRPEHIFTCGSPVNVGRFHPTEHHLVVGGCESGQVVVWDIRAGRLPVQKSSMATGSGLGGHAHPICSMEVVEGGSGLVTAATDGRLNFWSLANLRDPAESISVGANISCLAVAPESNTLICGDEIGGLHTILASTDASATATSGASSRRTVRRIDAGPDSGHFGMVTGVSAKVAPSGAGGLIARGFLRGASGLVLTCGVDWTTRLWAPAYADEPLLTLPSHSYDYMSDVQWSPSHPSIFATASSSGALGFWNLAASLDEPITGSEGIVVELDGPSSQVPRGLNKIRWSQDGRRIAAASSDRLHVISVSDDISKPKADDEVNMMDNLTARGLLDEL